MSVFSMFRARPLGRASPAETVWGWCLSAVSVMSLVMLSLIAARIVELLARVHVTAPQEGQTWFQRWWQGSELLPENWDPAAKIRVLVLLGLAWMAAHILTRFGVERWARRRAERATSGLRQALREQARLVESAEIIRRHDLHGVDLFANGAELIRQSLAAWWSVIPFDILLLTAMALLAVAVHAWIGLAAVLLVCFGVLLLAVQEQRAREQQDLQAELVASQLQRLVEDLRQPRLVVGRMLSQTPHEPFAVALARYERTSLAQQSAASSGRFLVATFVAMTVALLIFLIEANIFGDPPRLDLAGAVLVLAALGWSYRPVRRIRGLNMLIPRANPVFTAVLNYLDRAPRVLESSDPHPTPAFSGTIEFQHVTVLDDDGHKLLDDVTFEIPPRHHVAIVTTDVETPMTLACALLRYLDPQRGAVRIDDQDLRRYTLDGLRGRMALVLRQGALFPGTVVENITCGDATFSAAQIADAVKATRLDDFVTLLPEGFETRLGEPASALGASGVFCLAATRALLRDPRVVMVEEPRPEDDGEVAAIVDEALATLARDRTAIFFAQRLSTLRAADRVLVFVGGKLHLQGNHNDLVQSSDLYRHMIYVRFTELNP